jgi:hypothetical protein
MIMKIPNEFLQKFVKSLLVCLVSHQPNEVKLTEEDLPKGFKKGLSKQVSR